MNRRKWLASTSALATGSLIGPAAVRANNWPSRPIRLVVPYAPGGSADAAGRLFAQHVSTSLGVPVVVENVTGAGGVVGVDQVRRMPPDGYNFVFGGSATHSVNLVASKTNPYDPVADFEPVTLTLKYANTLFVSSGSPARTLADVEAMARKDPGLPYATSGVGSTSFLAGELLRSYAKIIMTPVHYKGIGPAMIDVIGGSVPIGFGDVVALSPHIASKKVRVIAVASAKRVRALPDLPSIAEVYPGYESVAWQALFGPKGTPAEIIARLNGEFVKAMNRPEVRNQIESVGGEIVASSPAELTAFMKADIDKWKRLVKEMNIAFE